MSSVATSKIAYLKMIDIFQDLSRPEIEEMDAALTMTTCRKGKVFFQPEDTSEVLFVLKRGAVQFYKISADGKKLVVDTAEAGTVFGEMSLLGQEMQSTFAEATEDCLLCVMSRHDVERMVMQKPQVGLRMMQLLSSRVRHAETQLEALAFKSLAARLASLLLELGKHSNGDIRGYTHQDFADHVGVYRETVTQTLNEFKTAGIITTGRKKVTILNAAALQKMAEI